MECYATPWPLWRESRNLLHFIEPSFAFGASLLKASFWGLFRTDFINHYKMVTKQANIFLSLSHFLPHCSLFSFPFRRVSARLQARGIAIKKNSLKP